MTHSSPPSPPADEQEQSEMASIFRHYGADGDVREVYRLVEGQHTIVHQRAQALTQLAGVVITVTGFSGRIIADTNVTAQVCIVAGLVLVLCSAAIALLFVMPIRWMSSYLDLPPEQWLLTALRRRKRKSRAFALATWILILGLLFYVAAISLMLLNPEAAELTRVR